MTYIHQNPFAYYVENKIEAYSLWAAALFENHPTDLAAPRVCASIS